MQTNFKTKMTFSNVFVFFIVAQLIFTLVYVNTKQVIDWELIAISLVVFILTVTTSLSIECSSKEFVFSMRPFHISKRKIEWTEIKKIQLTTLDAISMGGWGIRYSKAFGWSFIIKGGDAIILTLKNGKKRTFSIKNNMKFVRFLEESGIKYTIE